MGALCDTTSMSVTGTGSFGTPFAFSALTTDDSGSYNWNMTVDLSGQGITSGVPAPSIEESTTGVSLTSGIQEVQSFWVVATTNGADGGSFTVTGTGGTESIDWNALTADVQTAVNSAGGWTGNVTGSGTEDDPWVFTNAAYGPQSLLSADFSGLTLDGITPTVTQTQAGHS